MVEALMHEPGVREGEIDEIVSPSLLPVPTTLAEVQIGTLTGSTPAEIINAAKAIADVLAPIVKEKHLYTEIQGKNHVHVDAWTTLMVILGCTPHEVANGPLGTDGTYLAEVEVRTIRDGRVIVKASAECGGPKEPSWNKRPPYARRSMAATRAVGKAGRLGFSWIMILAGYEPTPYEDLGHDGVVIVQQPEDPLQWNAGGKFEGLTWEEAVEKDRDYVRMLLDEDRIKTPELKVALEQALFDLEPATDDQVYDLSRLAMVKPLKDREKAWIDSVVTGKRKETRGVLESVLLTIGERPDVREIEEAEAADDAADDGLMNAIQEQKGPGS